MILILSAAVAAAPPTKTFGEYQAEQAAKKAFAAGGAAPPDSLAGYTVQATLDRTGLKCTLVECEKVGAVAGRPGTITIGLCGDRVSSVAFRQVWLTGYDGPPRLYELMGAVVAENPRERLFSAIDQLHEELRGLGWTTSVNREARMTLDPGIIASAWYAHGDGRERFVSAVFMVEGKKQTGQLSIATQQGECCAGL